LGGFFRIDTRPLGLKDALSTFVRPTMTLIYVLDLLAVSVCAITATLEARRSELDLFGVAVVAVIAGIGGGTLRDLLLGRLPVYWVHDASYVTVGLAASLATFFASGQRNVPKNLFLIPDALGLALFTVIGTSIAMQMQVNWLIAALMGVITAVFGGVIRDMLCNEVPLIFRADLYATASLVGALLLIALDGAGLAHPLAVVLAMLGTVSIRLAAIRWKIHLPRMHPGS